MSQPAESAPSQSKSAASSADRAGTWLSRIEQAQRDQKQWNDRCKKIRRRFTQEGSANAKKRRFQLLWANQMILRPAVYAKCPSPVVTNRWKDGDPVARLCCELLERNLDFQFDVNAFDDTFRDVRDDYLLYGRGVPRLVYEPVFEPADIEDGADDKDTEEGGDPGEAETDENGEIEEPAPEQEKLKFENIRLEFVQREDLIHPKSRTWRELPWLCFRAFLSREALKKRFTETMKDGSTLGEVIELDAKATGSQTESDSDRNETPDDKATIYEIWDKEAQKVIWVAKGYGEILEEDAPYLEVDGFYPCPRPAYGTIATDSLEPVPDWVYYQDQAEEIDELTARMAALQDSLKLVGFYPQGPGGEGAPEIELAMRPGIENRMIGVKSWTVFQELGKGGAAIIWLPIEMVAKILTECVKLRKQLIDDVYQITGISDILRGATDAEETAAAQGIKAQWGNIRMRDRQKELARVARDVTRLAAQIMAKHFSIETMLKTANMKLPTDAEVAQKRAAFEQAVEQYKQMLAQQAPAPAAPAAAPGAPPSPGQPPAAGGAPQPQPPPPQWQDPGPTQEMVESLMRDEITRRFLIDIEVDSTIAADEAAEKDARTKFVEAVSHFVVAWAPLVQGNPALVDLAGELLLFAVRAFPVGRELEETIQKAMDKLAELAGQPKPPGPEQLKAQADMQRTHAEIEKAQIDLQAAMLKAKADVERAQLDGQIAAQKNQMELQKSQLQAQLDERKIGMQHAAETQKMSMQRDIAVMSHQHAMAEHAAKQKTLADTVQAAEQKAVAKEAIKGSLGPEHS